MPTGATTSERVYAGVKAELMGGAFLPGERLDASTLAMRFAASITPVRAALHRLAGERLVDAYPNDGFHAPRITEPGLRDIYDWNRHILEMALATVRSAGKPPLGWAYVRTQADIVPATETLFIAITALSGNTEAEYAVRGVNDRLHAVRHAKGELVDNREAELADMEEALADADYDRLEASLRAYHDRRHEHVPELVRRLHRRRN